MRTRYLLGITIPAALLIWATTALPYTLEHSQGVYVHWDPAAPVTMVYNLTFPTPSAAMQADLAQATIHHVLIDEWNAALGTLPIAMRFVDGGTSTVKNAACDGVNLITFTDTSTSFPTGVLAFTSFYNVASPGLVGGCGSKNINTTFVGQLIDTDITFNPIYAISPVGLNGLIGALPTATVPTDLEGTLLHEAGHVLGLHHSGIISSRMVAFGDQFFGIRTLTTDDIAGINAAYSVNVPGGSVSGTVVDQKGNPVGAAHVVLTDATTGQVTVSALSQADGTYKIVGVPPSSYKAYVEPLDLPERVVDIPSDLQPGASYVTNGVASFTTSFLSQTLTVAAGTPVTGTNFTVTNPETGNLSQMGVSQGSLGSSSGASISARRGVNTTLTWFGNGLSGDGTTSVPSQYMAASNSTTTTTTSSQLTRSYTLSATSPVGSYNLYAGTPPALALTGALMLVPNPAVVTVVEGAAFSQVPNAKNQIAQGSFISIFGSDMAAANVTNYVFPVPTQLGGVSVKIGNRLAPLFFVSPGQINAMVPYDVSGTVDLEVITGSNTVFDYGNITLGSSAPRIFVAGTQTSTGGGVGAIQNGSQSNVPVTGSTPASAGDVLVMYLSGLGVTTPATTTGLGGSTGVVSGVTVTIGGKTAVVAYAGVSPGFAGLYQVNATVPAGLGAGNVNVIVTDGQGNQSNVVTVAVH